MPLLPLELPPGVYRQGTDIQASGRWRDANLVRWHEGTFGPVGGWLDRATVASGVPIRGSTAWRENAGTRWIAAGTYAGAYVISELDVVTEITPIGFTSGLESAGFNTGYGGGPYGVEAYGTPRTEGGALTEATTWAFDTWGELLLGCSVADGGLYEWDLNTANDFVAVTNAPTDCSSFIVTDERFIFVLGSGNRRRVRWCDREDRNTWTAAATNEAGDFDLQTSGTVQCGLRVRGQTLILTDLDAHIATYQGPPFVYGFERVGTNCGVISRKAAAPVEGGAMWMGRAGFFRYAGGVVEPVFCDVEEYVFGRMTVAQRSKVCAIANAQHNEVVWFYPSGTEVDSYATYNYRENHWSIGSLARTSGFDAGIYAQPIWFGADGMAYDHEIGFAYDGAAPYAESGPISLGAGDQTLTAVELIPDEKTQGDTTVTFKTRFHPNDTEREYGPYTMANPTSVRFTGRQARMYVEGVTSSAWRVGVPRLDVRPGSRR